MINLSKCLFQVTEMEKLFQNAVAHLGIGTIKGSSNKNKISSEKKF